jgi:RHS repeat-associated protein
LTYFALYEAYGTRPYEWSDGVTGDPDRQKANTKEEESDLGLLNEGMRFRDLETGVFLTRDPIGYADGPNVYCYVHCNPITHFDPLGLSKDVVEKYKNAEKNAKEREAIAKQEKVAAQERASAAADAVNNAKDPQAKADARDALAIAETEFDTASKNYNKAQRVAKNCTNLRESAENGKFVPITLANGGVVQVQVWADGAGVNLATDRDISHYSGNGSNGRFVMLIHGPDESIVAGLSSLGSDGGTIAGIDLVAIAREIPTYVPGADVLLVSCEAANTKFHKDATIGFNSNVETSKVKPGFKAGLFQEMKHQVGLDYKTDLQPAPGPPNWVNLSPAQARQ